MNDNDLKKTNRKRSAVWMQSGLRIMEVLEMGYQKKDVEKTKTYAKKFVRYKEGAERYSIGLTKFQELVKEAHAVYKVDGIALVNCEIFDKFLETFREY